MSNKTALKIDQKLRMKLAEEAGTPFLYTNTADDDVVLILREDDGKLMGYRTYQSRTEVERQLREECRAEFTPFFLEVKSREEVNELYHRLNTNDADIVRNGSAPYPDEADEIDQMILWRRFNKALRNSQ